MNQSATFSLLYPQRLLTAVTAVMLLLSLGSARGEDSSTKNGFNLNSALIPADEILSGGPPRDGIPALDAPRFIAAARATELRADDRVLGITYNGISKAYPINIMNWHEIVNDRFGSDSVTVTFCPLCGTGVAYVTPPFAAAKGFGVSGLLYNSDVLLYDRVTESLWSQLLSSAISGPRAGETLTRLPLAHTRWGEWRKRHPDTLVLSRNTGFSRNYDRDPYAGYVDSRGLYFPVKHRDPRYHPKERVIGIELNGVARAYPFSELARTDGIVRDTIAGQPIKVIYNETAQSGYIVDRDDNELASITAFWFAWYAFHPVTEVFRP